MRKTMLWLDLAICFVWALVSAANMLWWAFPTHFLMLVTIGLRIVLSFVLYRGEKRSWLTLSCYMVLFVSLTLARRMIGSLNYLTNLPFAVLCVDYDHLTYNIVKCIFLAWVGLLPVVVYFVGLFRKSLNASSLSWKDALGAVLWKDREARLYCQMLLIAIGAWHIGLYMNLRLCLLGCIILSPLSYYLLDKYVGSGNQSSDIVKSSVGKIFLMTLGMAVFFYAQGLVGMWRVWMLLASFVIVAYVCWQRFGKNGLAITSLWSALYLGAVLPTMSIGYNQYTCIGYGRQGHSTLTPFRGIIFIEDSKTGKIGLRDRYGMLVKPEYESIVKMPNHRYYELRDKGIVKSYYVYTNIIAKRNDIDEDVQKVLCNIMDDFYDNNGYSYPDLSEVKVTELFDKKAVVAHVKMTRSYNDTHYDYSDKPFIAEDSVVMLSGEFASDTIVRFHETLNVLRYSYDVKRDDVPIYNIDIKVATKNIPEQKDLAELAKDIEAVLKDKQ